MGPMDFGRRSEQHLTVGHSRFAEGIPSQPVGTPMSDSPVCPNCKSTFAYPTGTSWMCPECGHEWDQDEMDAENLSAGQADTAVVVKDANGNVLRDGDDVVMIKDLAVKGAPKALKAGTKVRNIKLVDGDHNIDCRIGGFGAMALKSEFVRKA